MLAKNTQSALERSLTSGVFIDAKFYLFSRRTRDRSLASPRPVYAHSTNLIHTSSYFKSLLCGGFVEDRRKEAFDSNDSLRRTLSPDEYGYDSDSDVDQDDDETTPSPDHDTTTGGQPDPSDERSEAPRPAVEVPSSSGEGEASASAVTVSPNEKFTFSAPILNPRSDTHAFTLNGGIPVRYNVVIDDIAFRTFKALVYYSYTGEITFSPLRSIRKAPGSTTKPLSCSPKSIYRVADKYDIPSLKSLALSNIRSQLSPAIAIKELFSLFTSRYPEIIDMEAAYVRDHRNDVKCLSDLPAWTDRIARGELPHASASLVALISKLAGSSTFGSGKW
ncbi:hypothetical protein OH76DRAFT_1482610 [Lentinus brumalis]|uniref:BTB domain-containing protein n=1 Tax=Lentinus brumalis TaxID=2498619 RepID=A0A371DC64_9APHY|nr:hypothetical protein OH76DRAFT_1482610 [Polyporus brumalis]